MRGGIEATVVRKNIVGTVFSQGRLDASRSAYYPGATMSRIAAKFKGACPNRDKMKRRNKQ
jgi:hypothetical protein